MPLYEYECTACHRHTEKIQKFSDPEITTCPLCGGTLQRVITAPAIAFKGGGWYADGYGNAKPAVASENKPAGESKAASESGSTESSNKAAPAETCAPASSTPAATPTPAPSSPPKP